MPPRTPLFDPGAYFRSQSEWEQLLRRPLVVGIGSVVLVTCAYFAVSTVVGELASGTVLVENPAYPGDQFCDTELSTEASGCDEPATVERSRSDVLAAAVWEFGSQVSVLTFFGFLVSTAILATASFRYHGDSPLSNGLQTAAWGTVPFALALAINAPILGYAALEGGASADVGQTLVRSTAVMWLFTIGASLWAAYLWYAGLRLRHGVSDRQATLTVASLFVSAIVWSVALYGL